MRVLPEESPVGLVWLLNSHPFVCLLISQSLRRLVVQGNLEYFRPRQVTQVGVSSNSIESALDKAY